MACPSCTWGPCQSADPQSVRHHLTSRLSKTMDGNTAMLLVVDEASRKVEVTPRAPTSFLNAEKPPAYRALLRLADGFPWCRLAVSVLELAVDVSSVQSELNHSLSMFVQDDLVVRRDPTIAFNDDPLVLAEVTAHLAGRMASMPWIGWRETRARTASIAVWA